MKNFVKKTAATALSVFGILSAMPSAFCAPDGKNNEKGHIDPFHIMIVGKYFDSVKDFQNLAMANKKYGDLTKRYHFNPVEIDSERDAALFPKMQTYCCRKSDKELVYEFPKGKDIKRLVYLPHSFNSLDFAEVLTRNEITDKFGKFTNKWERNLEINDNDPMKGCCVTFKNGDKEIIFMFSPSYNGNLIGSSNFSVSDIEGYNAYLQVCGIEDAAQVTLKEEMVIPSYITSIGPSVFIQCENLKEVNISNSVTKIGDYAFAWCENLTKINIPKTVTSIGTDTFYGCTNLNHIEYDGKVYTTVDSFMEAFKAANSKLGFCEIC